jgi:CHAT domain-containing protein
LRDYTKDTRYGETTDRNLLNPLEKPVFAAANDKIKLGDRLTQCEQTKCSDRSQLIAQVTQANETFDQQVIRLKKALKAGESQDPAQLQNEEFTRNAQDIILNNPRKTILLYPLVLDDKLWLVWGSQAGKKGVIFDSKQIPVTRKDLSAKVLDLQDLLKNPNSDPQKIQKISQQLYQWLLQPIRQQLTDNKIENIVFSLDRATRYIPMAALHDGQKYLIENFTLSTILTAKTDTTDKLSPTISENPVLSLGVSQAIGTFSALPAVESELASISQIFPGMKWLNQDFTEATLRENIADHRILHLATHGSFNTDNPDNSFLLLGNGKQLTIPTIQSMKNLAGTHLVVLSACETGKGGMTSEGMEVAGIGHYFLRSGAKSVMASLWLVNDPATALLMRDFYSNLATAKLTKAEALRQTQLAFIKGDRTTNNFTDLDRKASGSPNRAGARPDIPTRSLSNSLAHPYYWAPFILIGNGL